MLSDPLSVTYNGSAKSLPRTGGSTRGVKKVLANSVYNTADGEFTVRTVHSLMGDGGHRMEITLSRRVPDPDSDPLTGATSSVWTNSVGLVYEFNDSHYQTNTDIPLLQTALLSLVDSTLRGRLLGGEI